MLLKFQGNEINPSSPLPKPSKLTAILSKRKEEENGKGLGPRNRIRPFGYRPPTFPRSIHLHGSSPLTESMQRSIERSSVADTTVGLDCASSGPCGNTRERPGTNCDFIIIAPDLSSPFSSCSGNRRRGPCLLNGDPSPVPPSNASRIRDVVTLSETAKRKQLVCRAG